MGVLQGPGVLVVPVRVGGGARTKVLEALACGMPVVSTTWGVENLGLVAGRDFLPADTAEEMIEAVTRLAGDPDLARSLGRAGAARAESFRWSAIETALEPIYGQAASGAYAPARAASLQHGGTSWTVPPEIARLQAELIAQERARPWRSAEKAIRRWRRTGVVRRLETAAIRWIDWLGRIRGRS